jgi:asparagine N-glycosylation enzyme membrane subunit Stt3
MKLQPIFDWWLNNVGEPIETRIGFRANEKSRAKTMLNKTNKDGLTEYKTIVGKRKSRNKWATIGWQKPVFPLIDENIYKDQIVKYWQNKPVRFAYMNNCIGCFHRNEVLLKFMSELHPNKFNWFIEAENQTGYNIRTFKNGINYKQIKNSFSQIRLFEDDFNDCDSGYCGL